MKVILREDVKGIGKQGEIKEVADAMARNLLIPKGQAVVADAAAINNMMQQKKKAEKKKEQKQQKAKDQEQTVKEAELDFTVKLSDKGHLFGSVDAKAVAKELKKKYQVSIPASKITVDHIKSPGKYEARVMVNGKEIPVKVNVHA